jgi:hypothetical protein
MHDKETKELRIIRFSLLALFSSLMVIYLLLYEVKGDEFKQQSEPINTDTTTQQTSLETKTENQNLYPEDSASNETSKTSETSIDEQTGKQQTDKQQT